MAMPLDYALSHRAARPFGEVAPIIDATTSAEAIRQILDFMRRHQGFRIGVPDTSFFPFSAICRLDLTFPSGHYHGTGFFIGNDLILTCGHNLFDKTPDKSGTESATRVTVNVGQQNATTRLDRFDVTPSDWTVHPTWAASGANDRGWDLSVIRTPKGPPAGAHFQLINYSPSPETPIAVCGYGDDTNVDGQRQHLDIDRVRAISDSGENVDYNLQTRGGNSGSPVFAHFTDTASLPSETIPVMGVHVASESGTLNRGVLLTPDKIEWALGGGISSVRVFSLSAPRSSLGGLPILARGHGTLGGLPLLAAGAQPMLRTQSVARPRERSWIVIDQKATGGMSVARRTFGHPTGDLSGKTTLSVRVPNVPSGGKVVWNVPDDEHKARVVFETSGGGTGHTAGGTTVTLRSVAAGPVAVDCMVKDASGKTVESNKYWLSSPQFVFVARHPSVDTFLDGIGLGTRRAAVYAEMAETMRHLYRNVNIRFILPGDALPAHLRVGANAAFPGGVEALPSVYYSETIGDPAIDDPEASHDNGAPTPYGAGVIGRNHEPGDLPAPLDRHSIARSLAHRLDGIGGVAPIQAASAAGTLSAADLDLTARMFGRLMGENAAHEVGHFMANAFVEHDPTGGFMENGADRSFTERTGMTATGGADPILNDAGRATVNDLSPDLLRVFEEFLPIDPPIDQARIRSRGRVGSFSHRRTNGAAPHARPFAEPTVHLPGATVLSGWKADAFIALLDKGFQSLLALNPMNLVNPAASFMLAPFVNTRNILAACDAAGVTLAIGTGVLSGLGAGVGGSFGLVFAPGQRIGFYGTGSLAVGWLYSTGASVQVTLINGGPELMDGAGYMAGVSISTIGWFTADLADAPLGAHLVLSGNREPIGVSFEFGLSSSVPIIGLIGAYAQATRTAAIFGRQRPGARGLSAAGAPSDAREAALREALARGASPAEAEAFLATLFP